MSSQPPTVPTSSVSRRAALRGLGGLTAALLLAATPRFARAESAHTSTQSETFAAPSSVVGAWDLTFRHDADAASGLDRALVTFGVEGGFQAGLAPAWITAAGSPRFHGGGHGSWATNDDGVVEAQYTTLIYDETGAYDGARQVRIRATLDSDILLTGAYGSYVYDAEGSLIDLVSGSVAGIVAGNPATGSRGYPGGIASDLWVVSPQPGQSGWPF